MKMETNVPFQGFYGSIWDQEIDDQAEREAEYMVSDEGSWSGFEQADVQEVLFRHTDHESIFREIAKLYVDAWQDVVNEELGIKISLDYTLMVSPKEYNFITDRLFAEISRDDIAQVYRKVGRQRLRVMAERMFTSRSGFISFYSPNVEDWGPVREWDYNQLGCLMEAADAMIEDSVWEVYYAIQESLYNAYSDNVDWPAVERDLQHMVDIENGEAEEDARRFPAGSTRDVREYARQFSELNHLKGAEE